jgi:GTPase
MFVDEAKIYVKAGDGGNGCVSFRREKFAPHGGPDGGDGGDGGDVVFIVDRNVNTLLRFQYNQHFTAENGERGMGKKMYGQHGETLVVPVPPGTIVRDEDSREVLADLSDPDDRYIAAHGGRGGRGNARFATAVNQAPQHADPGGTGEERTIRLELKVLADVGLVGFPNAGKSTLLSVVSSAHPKIADYPFTTLQPNLGIVTYDNLKTFVVADIPGIIEGAHEGKGLGLRFLRHIERTKMLLFLIDCTSEDPVDVYEKLVGELRLYSETLLAKPRLIALTKTDLLPPDEKPAAPVFGSGIETFVISAATGDGIKPLIYRLGALVESLRV